MLKFPYCEFPFICSSIPTAAAYGLYLSQLIINSRGIGFYLGFHW